MKKLFAIMFIVFFFASVSSFGYDEGESIGTFKQDSCIDLIQTCGNCTYNNLTSIQYPNTTRIEIDDTMTQDGSVYNYTNCFPSLSGKYFINGLGDENGVNTTWNFKLTLSSSGLAPTIAQAFMHGIILFIMIFFLAITLFFAVTIDGKNEYQMGKIIRINYAKYLKQGLFFVSYLLLTFMFGMAWIISDNYLTFTIGTSIFKMLFTVLWVLILPIFIMFVVFSLIKFALDIKLENFKLRNLGLQ
jgi:hypothetical protein